MAIDWENLKKKAQEQTRQQYEAAVADTKKRQQATIASRQPGYLMGNSGITSQGTQDRLNGSTQSVLAQVQNEQKRKSLLNAITSSSKNTITPVSMAQTAANVANGAAANAFQNQPESGIERVSDTLSSGLKNVAGGLVNTGSMVSTGKYSPMVATSRLIDKMFGKNTTDENKAKQKALVEKIMQSGRSDTENAKRGLSAAGQTAVDIGSGATQLAGNIALGALTGGSALVPMATQSFGSGAYTAEKAGASEEKQLAYGALEGGTVALTQGLMNAGSSILTKSFGESPVSKMLMDKTGSAIAKFVQSDAGRIVANKIASTGESALSQSAIGAIQAALEPAYQKITYNPNAKESAEDIIHNAIVSGAIGALVGAAGKTPERIKSAEDNYVEPVKSPVIESLANPVTDTKTNANALTEPQRAPETVKSNNVTDTPVLDEALQTSKEQSPATANDGLGAMDTQFPYKEAATQSALQENLLTKQERADNNIDSTHQVYTDEMARTQAQQRLSLDYNGEKADLLKKQDWDKGDDVTAQYIIKQETEQARKTGDWTEAKKIWKVYQEHGTTAGQELQARKQFQSDPDFAAAEAADTLSGPKAKKLPQNTKQDVINKVYEQTQKLDSLQSGDADGLIALIEKNNEIRHTTGIFRTTTSKHVDNMLRDYLSAYGADGEANLRDVALSQIRNIASDYEKTPFVEKASSLYINGLLSKISTVMRNVVGNTGFDAIDSGANNVAVPLDALVSKLTGTRSISVDKSWFSSAKRQGSSEAFARSCIETSLDVNTNGAQSKFEQNSNRTFKMTGNFAERLFSTYERNISYLLTTPDEFAKGGVAAESARGLNELAAKGKITDAEFLKSRPQELAKQRTFQDESNLAKGLITLRNAGNEIAGVTTNSGEKVGLGTFAAPFAKVPANLVNEAINYSPAGIVKGGTWLAKTLIDAKIGNLDIHAQANAVTDIGRGLTGTAMIALATALAAKGIIKVSNDKDWNKAALEKSENKTGTQLNASAMWRWLHDRSADWKSGDSLVNVGFADPFNTFLATGALISDSYKADGKLTTSNLANSSASAVIQSVMDLPAISTLSSIQSGYNYSKSDTEAGKVADAALSYARSAATGVVPNFVKGIAAGTDQYTRDTSADTKKQQFLNQLMSGIPGAREKLPIAYDALGNEKTSGSTPVMQFLNNNILPGTVTNYKPNEVTDELSRVAQSTGAKSLFPSAKVDSTIQNNNQKYDLNNKQKQDFLKTSGSMMQDYLEKLIGSSVYKTATDEEKSGLIDKMSTYASDKAKSQVVSNRGGTFTKNTYDNVAKAEQAGIAPTSYYAYQQYLKKIDTNGGNSTQAQETQAINKTADLSTQMKGKLWSLQNKDTKEEKNPYTGTLAQMGVSPETIISFMQKKSELDDEPNEDFGQTTVSKANKGRAYQLWQYAKSLDLSPAQRNALYDMYQEWGFIPSLSLETIGKKGY